MGIAWGYSPKIEKYIPLGDFPADRYLIIAAQAIENLGWKLSHVSEAGVIAYTPISFQSYSEEISIRIQNNFAIVKSECVGIQMWFNDYGKNASNFEKFFHEFEYVEFHLKDVWEESLAKFHEFAATQDVNYFEKAPLTAKDKIKNILYLFFPQRNYTVTPILVLLNIFLFFVKAVFTVIYIRYLFTHKSAIGDIQNIGVYVGANSRELVLSGQYWRLLTYQFVHASFFHLFFNMYALVYIGLMVEHKLGVKKFLSIYLLSGICGGILSLLYHDVGFMVGASGSIMGLFGAFMALLISKAFEKNAARALLISTILVTLIMLINGLSGKADNAAHVGGLVSGFIIAFLLFNEKPLTIRVPLPIRYVVSLILVVVFAGLTIFLTPNYQTAAFNKLERVYQRNAFKFDFVYRIHNGQSKELKLKLLQENGIEVWAKNDSLVKKMDKLILNKEQRLKVDFHKKMVARAKPLVALFYKQVAEDNPFKYRQEIMSLSYDINNVRLAADRTITSRY